MSESDKLKSEQQAQALERLTKQQALALERLTKQQTQALEGLTKQHQAQMLALRAQVLSLSSALTENDKFRADEQAQALEQFTKKHTQILEIFMLKHQESYLVHHLIELEKSNQALMLELKS